jgi:hypothetical protein
MRLPWAKHELELVLQTSNESVFQTFGGRLEFEKKMSAAIENPTVLEKIVQSQIEQLGLKDICNSEIDCEARA